MVLTIGSEAEWAGAYPLSLPERKQNINCRIMRQLIFPVAKKAKRLGGKRHVLIQKSPTSWRRNIRCRIMRHLIFSIVGSTPESPSVNPPGAGTIGFETEYQVQHNVAPDILLECRLLFYSWHVLHGQALPGSMSGSLKTILRGSTSRVNMPNAQSNDCARSPTNDGNGNATGRDLAAGSLNAPLRPWWLPYTKLFPPYHSPAQRRFGISGAE